MKPPVPVNAKEACQLAAIICAIVPRMAVMYSEELTLDAWRSNTFDRIVKNDWEYEWTDEQCRAIAVAWRIDDP